MDEFERQRSSFDERIKLFLEKGDVEAVKKYQREEEALENPRPRIEREYAPKVDALEKDLAPLRSEFDRKQMESAPMSPAERQRFEAKQDGLRNQLTESDKKWQGMLSQANEEINNALTLQNKHINDSLALDHKQEEIRVEVDKLERERLETARLDQIRRIAARIYRQKPEDVSSDKVDIVSNVWFGSLALLAALAGPMTAMVSLELQKLGDGDKDDRRSTMVRRLWLSWRWRRVRTVKVPVEVPVEKEVEKRVEVPVERIIKEIMYVPIFTDDPEVLRRTLRRAINRSSEKDLADHLTFSVASSENGNTPLHQTS